MGSVFGYVTYLSVFIGLYFEVFLMLTLFDKEARRRRSLAEPAVFPSVTIIVPCHNEEHTVAGTVDSILALDYPKDLLSVIIVDDGSTDRTAEVIEAYRQNPQVSIIHKEKGGKHTALNAGIAASKSEFVGCLDADSFVTPQALKLVMANFDHEKIGAVAASMSVNKPRNLLERMQEAEYLLSITSRHTMAIWNGLYVTPGPFTIYRKKAFDAIGYFRPAHNTEDLEIALRLQRGGWRIQNAPGAGVYTNAPKTVKALVKQRVRWTTGFMRNAMDYRDLIGNPAYGVLGLMVLPLAVVFIFAGVAFFGISVWNTIASLWQFIERASEVPLSFTFALHPFDFFFAPITASLFFSLVLTTMTLLLIFIGGGLAGKKTKLGLSLIAYFTLYSLIAVWWRVRAIYDVVFGIRRSWR
ncbi:MAG: glycosyltransferase family 2 protein [Patescibacteria group bacterium]|nr:glycosyltransferase family 2 protein [Patescibacteria group bacterium]